jgi:hypothetical protein
MPTVPSVTNILKGEIPTNLPSVTDLLKGGIQKVQNHLPLPATLPEIVRQERETTTNNSSTINNQAFSKQNKSISINIGDIKVSVGGESGVDINSIGQQIKSQLESAMSNSWRGSMFDI